MITSFENKTAFITGAASGIGLEIARTLLSRGSNVMMADIDAQKLSAAAAGLTNYADQIQTVICNVAQAEDIQAAADKTIEKYGKVHMVFNNVGVSLGGNAGSVPLEDWRWIVDINLMGVVYGVEIFTPLIKSHAEGGHIVNTASMAGHWGMPGLGPYNATKFAVVGYSETIAQELAPENIGVSVLCPGWVATNIHNTVAERPTAGLFQPSKNEEALHAATSALVENGLPPSLVADMVADSILAGRSHIFTHEEMKSAIEMRMEHLKSTYDDCLEHPKLKSHVAQNFKI